MRHANTFADATRICPAPATHNSGISTFINTAPRCPQYTDHTSLRKSPHVRLYLHGNVNKEDAQMNDELKSGWTLEASSGAIYHFEHIATEIAEEMDELREGVYVL